MVCSSTTRYPGSQGEHAPKLNISITSLCMMCCIRRSNSSQRIRHNQTRLSTCCKMKIAFYSTRILSSTIQSCYSQAQCWNIWRWCFVNRGFWMEREPCSLTFNRIQQNTWNSDLNWVSLYCQFKFTRGGIKNYHFYLITNGRSMLWFLLIIFILYKV